MTTTQVLRWARVRAIRLQRVVGRRKCVVGSRTADADLVAEGERDQRAADLRDAALSPRP